VDDHNSPLAIDKPSPGCIEPLARRPSPSPALNLHRVTKGVTKTGFYPTVKKINILNSDNKQSAKTIMTSVH
jgi:hypothetical protein